MTTAFDEEIAAALGGDDPAAATVRETGSGALPSVFEVSGLAVASLAAAAREPDSPVHIPPAARAGRSSSPRRGP